MMNLSMNIEMLQRKEDELKTKILQPLELSNDYKANDPEKERKFIEDHLSKLTDQINRIGGREELKT
jgi:hypothetical protein